MNRKNKQRRPIKKSPSPTLREKDYDTVPFEGVPQSVRDLINLDDFGGRVWMAPEYARKIGIKLDE